MTQHPSVGMALALIVGSVALYARSISYPFVNLDDPFYVFANPHVVGGLTLENIRWAMTTGDLSNWHPLTWLSLQLDATLWGADSPAGFRATNILLHGVNASLLFRFLMQATNAIGRSAVVAALWAVHPLHVESVVWITERKDVLSQFLGLLGLIAYVRYTRRPTGGRSVWVLVCLALGLMAKPMLVTFPAVVLLLDYWPLRRGVRIVEKWPLFALAAVSSVITLIVQSRGSAVESLDRLGLTARLANASYGYGQYLWQTIWPADLAIFYPYVPRSLTDPEVWGSALILVLLTGLTLATRRRYPYLLAGWLWFAGTLVPVIGLVHVGSQSHADRYTYWPHIGLFLAGVWGLADLLQRWPVVRATAAAIVILGAAGACWVQIGHWRSDRALWEQALRATGPNNPLARLNRGMILAQEVGPTAALEDLQAAVALAPANATARRFLGGVLCELGRFDEAIPHLEEAVRLRPTDAEAQGILAAVRREALGRPPRSSP